MDSLLLAAVWFFYGTWLLLTVFFQIEQFSPWLSKYDILRLIPKWTFFSPNPGQHDLHLLIRDELSSGELSGWREVGICKTDTAIPPIWNPDKRIPKILWDAWASIQYLTRTQGVKSDYLKLSGAYLMLLNLALREAPLPMASNRQFSLVRSNGFTQRTMEPLFVSSFHKLT